MIGHNKLSMNQATLAQAIEDYMNAQRNERLPKLKVTNVEAAGSSRSACSAFAVDVDFEVSEDIPPPKQRYPYGQDDKNF